MSEEEVLQRILLEAPKHGISLWRNNSGVLNNSEGRPVRFGLGNISSRINDTFKSSDLIGVTSNGIFIAIEVKKEDWKYNEEDREIAQLNFIAFIKSHNGIAGFCNSVDSFLKIIGR